MDNSLKIAANIEKTSIQTVIFVSFEAVYFKSFGGKVSLILGLDIFFCKLARMQIPCDIFNIEARLRKFFERKFKKSRVVRFRKVSS